MENFHYRWLLLAEQFDSAVSVILSGGDPSEELARMEDTAASHLCAKDMGFYVSEMIRLSAVCGNVKISRALGNKKQRGKQISAAFGTRGTLLLCASVCGSGLSEELAGILRSSDDLHIRSCICTGGNSGSAAERFDDLYYLVKTENYTVLSALLERNYLLGPDISRLLYTAVRQRSSKMTRLLLENSPRRFEMHELALLAAFDYEGADSFLFPEFGQFFKGCRCLGDHMGKVIIGSDTDGPERGDRIMEMLTFCRVSLEGRGMEHILRSAPRISRISMYSIADMFGCARPEAEQLRVLAADTLTVCCRDLTEICPESMETADALLRDTETRVIYDTSEYTPSGGYEERERVKDILRRRQLTVSEYLTDFMKLVLDTDMPSLIRLSVKKGLLHDNNIDEAVAYLIENRLYKALSAVNSEYMGRKKCYEKVR